MGVYYTDRFKQGVPMNNRDRAVAFFSIVLVMSFFMPLLGIEMGHW